jgi:hypothetical protein
MGQARAVVLGFGREKRPQPNLQEIAPSVGLSPKTGFD